MTTDSIYVSFDSDTLQYMVPVNTAITIYRPDGVLFRHFPAKLETWHFTYSGPIPPGTWKVELNTP